VSVESIAIALHHSRATGTAKLVLIGIANHDGDGGAWPTVATLARYAGVAPRNVQIALNKLEELHEIRRIIQAGGDHSIADARRPNRYQFLLSCPPACDHSRNHRTRADQTIFDDLSTGVTESSPHDAGITPTGDAGITQTVLVNPSTKTQEKALDPAARASLLRGRCVPPFKAHQFAGGICINGCGCYADGRVEDPRTGVVLLEADEVRA
jgi:hypothetical protein